MRQTEAVKKQQAVIRSEKECIPIGNIQKVTSGRPSVRPFKPPGLPSQTKVKSCSWCGMTPCHERTRCPVNDSICHKCQKKGHFGMVCRSAATVGALHDRDLLPDESERHSRVQLEIVFGM